MTDDDEQPAAGDANSATTSAAAPTEPSVPRAEEAGDEATAPSLEIQTYIGSQLRQAFDDVANQPIPDRFLELMRKLG